MKLCRPLYSVFFSICCLLQAAGCTRDMKPTPEDEARASLALQAAEEKYGVVRDPDVQNYLYYISTRLSAALARIGKQCDNCAITLLNTNTPLAYSPGPGQIVLSKGMLTRLQNEAELAFVVSHEMAHQVLGHYLSLKNTAPGTVVEFREQLEKDADHFAIGLMALAGYDPRFAPAALIHAYGKVSPDGNSVGYPELYARERQLEDEVMDAHWTPPGTIDRREFQKLRRGFAAER